MINNTIVLEKVNNSRVNKKVGLVTGAFDLFHSGHIRLIKESKNNCDILVVSLHTSYKTGKKPIIELNERLLMLQSIKYIDYIVMHTTENDLLDTIKILRPEIRIVGIHYKNKSFTGDYLSDKIIYHDYTKHPYNTNSLINIIKNI